MSHRITLDRTVSMNIDDRPLYNDNNKSKSATPSLIGRWKSFRNKNGDVKHELVNEKVFVEFPLGEDTPVSDIIEDNYNDELSIRICKDTIRHTLLDNMRMSAGDVKILLDIENGISAEELQKLLQNCNKSEKHITFLWVAFLKKGELFDIFGKLGIDYNFNLPGEGLTALHLSAFSGCVKCVKWLIEAGANINLMPELYSPLHCAVLGNSVESTRYLLNNGAKLSDTVLHSAVRANAVDCLPLLLTENIDINCLDASGVSPLHIAADRRMSQCMKIFLQCSKIDVDLPTRDKLNTALHLAAEGGYTECVLMLLEKGADHSKKNKKGQYPLHLAAKSQGAECVDELLKQGAEVNARDMDNRTPLHAAVGKTLLAVNIVEILIRRGADVNSKDRYGYTALHIATLNELSQCVDMLIMNGADISARTNGGLSCLSIISRKTTASLATICKKLDSSISLHDPEASNREIELKLDFRYLLQHSSGGETGLLKTFIDEGQKNMLEHPLCGAFLYIKWQKIRRYYFSRLILSGVFVLFLTLYVMTALAHNCYNSSQNGLQSDHELCKNNSIVGETLTENPEIMEIIWYIAVVLSICEAIRKLLGIAGYSSFKQYFMQWANMFEWFTIFSVFIISFIYKRHTYVWQNHVGAFAVLVGWTNLMVMIGQLPVFGTYVAMYTKVQKEFAKLLLAYACLLIGFTASFCVIFPTSEDFKTPLIGFVKMLVMMTGELDIQLLLGSGSQKSILLDISAHVIFILFVLFVTVVLMNLLVGIAVHDIQGLHKTAGLSKLVQQTELISFLELSLFQGYVPRHIVNLIKWTALISPSAYRVVLHVKPLNPRENRLPKHVLMACHDIARQQKRCTINSYSTATYRYAEEGNNKEENKIMMEELRILKDILQEQQNTLSELLAAINKKTTEL